MEEKEKVIKEKVTDDPWEEFLGQIDDRIEDPNSYHVGSTVIRNPSVSNANVPPARNASVPPVSQVNLPPVSNANPPARNTTVSLASNVNPSLARDSNALPVSNTNVNRATTITIEKFLFEAHQKDSYLVWRLNEKEGVYYCTGETVGFVNNYAKPGAKLTFEGLKSFPNRRRKWGEETKSFKSFGVEFDKKTQHLVLRVAYIELHKLVPRAVNLSTTAQAQETSPPAPPITSTSSQANILAALRKAPASPPAPSISTFYDDESLQPPPKKAKAEEKSTPAVFNISSAHFYAQLGAEEKDCLAFINCVKSSLVYRGIGNIIVLDPVFKAEESVEEFNEKIFSQIKLNTAQSELETTAMAPRQDKEEASEEENLTLPIDDRLVFVTAADTGDVDSNAALFTRTDQQDSEMERSEDEEEISEEEDLTPPVNDSSLFMANDTVNFNSNTVRFDQTPLSREEGGKEEEEIFGEDWMPSENSVTFYVLLANIARALAIIHQEGIARRIASAQEKAGENVLDLKILQERFLSETEFKANDSLKVRLAKVKMILENVTEWWHSTLSHLTQISALAFHNQCDSRYVKLYNADKNLFTFFLWYSVNSKAGNLDETFKMIELAVCKENLCFEWLKQNSQELQELMKLAQIGSPGDLEKIAEEIKNEFEHAKANKLGN